MEEKALTPGADELDHPEGGHLSLANKLQALFDSQEALTGKRPSYKSVAHDIQLRHGEKAISGGHIWKLATGRFDNPQIKHLTLLAEYFKVPVRYLLEDDDTFSAIEEEAELLRELREQTELLKALEDEGIRGIALELADARLSAEARKTLIDMIRFLKGQENAKGDSPNGSDSKPAADD